MSDLLYETYARWGAGTKMYMKPATAYSILCEMAFDDEWKIVWKKIPEFIPPKLAAAYQSRMFPALSKLSEVAEALKKFAPEHLQRFVKKRF